MDEVNSSPTHNISKTSKAQNTPYSIEQAKVNYGEVDCEEGGEADCEVVGEKQQDGLSFINLKDPLSLPQACGFLWNEKMVVQMNCRGYINAQFMQPEPSKYSYAPNIEAKTFIQPEHCYFSHHPGRFFYIKDEDTQQLFSLPYEPVRAKLEQFSFQLHNSKIVWNFVHLGFEITIELSLTKSDAVECWLFTLKNVSQSTRKISIYPYFTIGYMSWLNQSATYDENLNAIVASSVTAYQKVEDYFKNSHLKDKTFLLASVKPTAWHTNQQTFEGEGGLHFPDAIQDSLLGNQNARYQTPVAVMQYREIIPSGEQKSYRFLFGPAKDNAEILSLKQRYLPQDNAIRAQTDYRNYIKKGQGCLTIKSDDKAFDDMVNHWLPRQMFYHGDVNRLSTDPQTRNYIQDNMGMCFIKPEVARKAFILALSQQNSSGAMPEGVLLTPDAQLKYINQIPHSDHCVWLPICIAVYLNETADVGLFDLNVPYADSSKEHTVLQHLEASLDWLLQGQDHRGLNYIDQGDWCDPMNMVGYKGKGVSAWLSLATAYAITVFCDLCEQYNLPLTTTKLNDYRQKAKAINLAVNQYFWDGKWYARGITDDNKTFGVQRDIEGKIYLNPQSWALLSGAVNEDKIASMLTEIAAQLMTPYGVMMLAPSYTEMREDVGRITQKHPGVSENGSVYNHAAVFYAYSLFQHNKADQAFEVLKKMLPCAETCLQTGQLPVFIPNYYRGAYYQYPEQAGRSSHLFNTGTLAWVYRCLVEELVGIKGTKQGLIIQPKLPKNMNVLQGKRRFRGAVINFSIEKVNKKENIKEKIAEVTTPITSQSIAPKIIITLNNEILPTNEIHNIEAGKNYHLLITIHEGACASTNIK